VRQVAFLTRHHWPWLRQTDDGAGHHDGLAVHLEPDAADDWVVVYDDIEAPVETRVPRHRRILFVTEPPGQKRYSAAFANQFGILVSPYSIAAFHGRWVASHPAINWFYGVAFGAAGKMTARTGLADLRAMPVPENKLNRISVVCSTKSRLPRQRARLRLIERLRQEFPDSVCVFGRGFRSIGDKAEAIAPYRYHLVLENNDCPHFWTEKLADAYLGYSLPIFSGCRNVTDYFPEQSMVPLFDIDDHDRAVAVIGEVLKSDPWPRLLESIRAARTELIERQNLFSLIARLTGEDADESRSASGAPEVLWPGRACGWARSTIRKTLEKVGKRPSMGP
jgi:hypothetical protein